MVGNSYIGNISSLPVNHAESLGHCSALRLKRLTVRYFGVHDSDMTQQIRTRLGYSLHGIVIVFLALIPHSGRSQASTELTLGERLAHEYEKQVGLGSTPELEGISGYISSVGNRVASALPSHRAYQFVFDPNPAFKSAFALPDGYIILGGGRNRGAWRRH